MAETNNRKRKLSSGNLTSENQDDARKNQNTNENERCPVMNFEAESESISSTAQTDPTQPNSAVKSFSRFHPRNVVGTIGRKTTVLTRRTLRPARNSLQALNRAWEKINTYSPDLENGNNHQQRESIQRKKESLHQNYTLRLRKIKEKFKTKRQIRKDRFRSLQSTNPLQERFRKDLNQSRRENNKQAKFLEKLLEKHNKHLESL